MVYFDEVAFRVSFARKGFRSVAAVARAAGLKAPYLAQVARGLIPSDEVKEIVAGTLGVKVGDLWRPQPGVAA